LRAPAGRDKRAFHGVGGAPEHASPRAAPRHRGRVGGGARFLELRCKNVPKRDLYRLACALRERCAAAGALLVVNDEADVALAAGADGVHVGENDLPPAAARRVVGPERLVGASVHGAAEAARAAAAGVDYVGVGTIFASATKPGLRPAGLAVLSAALPELGAIPAFAIGGITRASLAAVLETGVHGAAVASAIADADDIEAETAAFLAEIARYSPEAENAQPFGRLAR
jgi:thiamine-phosphate pyrophosphorylase